jgi:hypothetical protein
MSWVLISIVVTTVLQWVLCGGSLAVLVVTIGRVIFITRVLGAMVNIKVSIGFEIAGAFLLVVWIIFTKSTVVWFDILFFVLLCGVSIFLQRLDDKLYLYVVEDMKEDD